MILAFLQNQWFKEPDRIAKIYEKHLANIYPVRRVQLNMKFLFFRSLTGQRIKKYFGSDIIDIILWEETSKNFGNKSTSVFPADEDHIKYALTYFNPGVVLTFGKIATNALAQVNWPKEKTIAGPHPAARLDSVGADLAAMSLRLDLWLSSYYKSMQHG